MTHQHERYTHNIQRYNLDHDIDGIVYKLNDIKQQQLIGCNNSYPQWAIAQKFPSNKCITTIQDIKIQIGRTGIITPVAILEPVNLGGVLITRASLHNFNQILKKDIRIKDKVVLERAGDVIPNITTVCNDSRNMKCKKFIFPTVCPTCQSKIVKYPNQSSYRCSGNWMCKVQLIQRFSHFVSKQGLNIVGLSQEKIKHLYEYGCITEYSDLFTLRSKKKNLSKLTQYCDGWSEKTLNNLLSAIDYSRTVEFHKLIYALGIMNIGTSTSRLLSSYWEDVNNIIENKLYIKTDNTFKIGSNVMKSINEFFSDSINSTIFRNLLRHINITYSIVSDKKSLFNNKNVALTGTFKEIDRVKIQNNIVTGGGHIVHNVSGNTNILLCGQNPGIKLEQAKKLGVKILLEDDLVKIIRECMKV